MGKVNVKRAEWRGKTGFWGQKLQKRRERQRKWGECKNYRETGRITTERQREVGGMRGPFKRESSELA